MKKLFTVLAVILFTASMWAESPQKMSYQAVVRNTKGALVVNQTVGVQISIYYYTTKVLTKNVYVETQTPTTNVNGLISIEIGTGTVVEGVFADIDWAGKFFYIKTEIDPGGRTSYSITSDTQILSVPYALHAKTASNIADNSVISSKITDLSIATADIANNAVTIAKLPAGATSNTFLRGDGTWAKPLSGKSYKSISYTDFISENSEWDFFTSSYGKYMTFSVAYLVAPLDLPHGAKITNITWHFFDNVVPNPPMNFEFRKKEFTVSSPTIISRYYSTGASPDVRSGSITMNHIVDNSNGFYNLAVQGNWISTDPAVASLSRICGAVIEYEHSTE